MAEVKWIKITTDMFDNRKIKYLRKLPDGNNIVLIWVMLLTMAGRCNANGMVFLTENIPYTPKMLADELEFEENTVLLALQALEQLQMIITDNGCFAITGWEEYQNVEGMEKIREQNRIRKQRQRQKEKLLLNESDNQCHVTSRDGHAIDIDIDKDIDKESNKARKRFTPPSLDEVSAYIKEKGYTIDPQRFIDYYESIGWMRGKNKMKDWKAAVRTWNSKEQPAASKPDPHKGQTAHCPYCESSGNLFWKSTQTGTYFCELCGESFKKNEVVWK